MIMQKTAPDFESRRMSGPLRLQAMSVAFPAALGLVCGQWAQTITMEFSNGKP